MSYFSSKNNVAKNSAIWTNNLTSFEKCKTKRRKIPNIEKNLSELCKMPRYAYIIGRFNYLAKDEKSRKVRYKMISKELTDLWSKLNFPIINKYSIERKIEKLIDNYDKHLKHIERSDFALNKVFDITDETGQWLSTEDKQLHMLQKNTQGEVGYTTMIGVPVHPSKVRMLHKGKHISRQPQVMEFDSDSSNEGKIDDKPYASDNEGYEPPLLHQKKEKRISMKIAVNIVKEANVSTRKASKISEIIASSDMTFPTLSQSGIYKSFMKTAKDIETNYIKELKNYKWCLHFDGKKMGKKEIQAIVLKNPNREIKLAVLVLDNGRASTIYEGIKKQLDKFDLWKSIKMIVSDTTNVNTGKKNGVVTLLQQHYRVVGLPEPQYVGCQHHILDLILRYVMDELLGGKTSSPNIAYTFVTELLNEYENLKENYDQNETILNFVNIQWRDDMQYLHELGAAFRHYEKYKTFPYIHFRPLPLLSNARWNSRAIFAILCFILMPEYRNELLPICKFVCGAWYDVWFSNHSFNKEDFSTLKASLVSFKNAHACFLRHWIKKDSAILNQQRSNICAERAIKAIQEIYPLCKNSRTLNLKYISLNK